MDSTQTGDAPEYLGSETSILAETDPPPIIIKSGSFTVESDEKITSSGSNRYRRTGFGPLRKIRLIQYNEIVPGDEDFKDYGIESADWSSTDEIQVNINLQSDTSTHQVAIVAQSGNVEFNMPIKLSSTKEKRFKRNRKFRREDEEDGILSFNRIQVINRTQSRIVANCEGGNGREFIIGFYPL